jgi:hypothetical protein
MDRRAQEFFKAFAKNQPQPPIPNATSSIWLPAGARPFRGPRPPRANRTPN